MIATDLRRLVANPPLILGILAVGVLIAIGAFGPMLAPYDPNATQPIIFRTLPGGSTAFQQPPTLPSADHWLGTDRLGRDQWSRILAGAWLTLSVVIGATLIRILIGVAIGITAGWSGGAVARVVAVLARGVTALPQLPLAILLVLVTRPLGILGFVGSLAVVGWPEIAEYTAVEARRVRAQEYVQAARSIGARDRRLIRTHLLSALTPQLLTLAALETGGVLLLLAELGIIGLFLTGATFLVLDFGFRISPLMGRTPEWGQMLGAIQFYAIGSQLSTLLPAVFVVIAAASFSLLADGLRAASDPFSTRSLRPRTFGVLAKVLAGALCFSAVGFIAPHFSTAPLTMREGLDAAYKVATHRDPPAFMLVAAVARYVSPADFERPAELTYYFRDERDEMLRVTFVNADPLSLEVRPNDSTDDLLFDGLQMFPVVFNPSDGHLSLAVDVAPYALVASRANDAHGAELRASTGAPIYRVVLSWPLHRDAPEYTVHIGKADRLTIWRFCCYSSKTGDPSPDAGWRRVE